MQHKHQPDYGRLRSEISRLFQAAGYELQELIDFINTAERETTVAGQLADLQQENERLKQEVARLRQLHQAKMESSMSSRLRDALRE